MQVHKRREEVRIFTRTLKDVTLALPEIVEAVRGFAAESVVLDGEAIALDSTGVLSNLPPHELEEWLNSGDLHRLQMPGGTELICLNSLLARLGSRQTK